MLAPLAKFIDWSALQMAYAVLRVKQVPRAEWKLEESLEFLNGPEAFPKQSEPARVVFDGQRKFTFPTPMPSELAENNIVYGRLYRCAQRWREQPMIILLDGHPPIGYHTAFPWLARRLNRAGMNVATLMSPYQLSRRPRKSFAWDCLKFARAMAQNIAEIRALVGWLLDEGCSSVGLVGFSFGGWTAGLTICNDARVSCAVMAVPAVRLGLGQPVIWEWARKLFEELRPARQALDTTRLNLTLSKPLIPKENILLIPGIYDLFVGREPIDELWEKWNRPEIWRLAHGHISGLLELGLTKRVIDWVKPRFEAGRS